MSKTVDDLIAVFEKARAEAAPFPQHHEDGLYAGIAAVVRALRDEMASVTAWHAINEILGDAGEKVADSGGAFGGLMDGLAKARATDPAPAVCEWTHLWKDMEWRACRPHQGGFYKGDWKDGDPCPCCKAPIKFTEAVK